MLKLSINRQLKTTEERNVAEIVEIMMLEKEQQFEKFLERISLLTSDMMWQGCVSFYNKGIYIEFSGTRSALNGFFDNQYNLIRKPRKLGEIRKKYDISGCGTEIEKVHMRKGNR